MNAELRRLLPHQQKALLYCQSTPTPLLFMEMRLGKTKVVIEWLRGTQGKILVVAPLTTVRSSWAEELRSEDEPEPAFLLGSKAERMEALALRRKWNLVNFEGLVECPNLLENYRWSAIVVDESTRIKNPKAEITKLLNKYRANADRRCILSGYPAPEGPLDYFEQFNFVHGGFLGFRNFWSFRNTCFFCPPRTFRWHVRPAFKDRIRNYVQKHAFVLSRKDVGMANEKIYERRVIPMELAQRKLMQKLEDEFALDLPNGTEQRTKWAPVKATWMARLAGGQLEGDQWFNGKFTETLDLLKGELKGQSVVMWFRFNEELFRMSSWLHSSGYKVGVLHGDVKDQERARTIAAFQAGETQLLLVQPMLGLHGLNFSRASTAIYFSNLYSSEIRVQSEDRIEHMSKKEPLLIIDLVTEDTVDEDAVRALRLKRKMNDYYLLRKIAEGVQRRVQTRASSDRSGNRTNRVGSLDGECFRPAPLRCRVIKR